MSRNPPVHKATTPPASNANNNTAAAVKSSHSLLDVIVEYDLTDHKEKHTHDIHRTFPSSLTHKQIDFDRVKGSMGLGQFCETFRGTCLHDRGTKHAVAVKIPLFQPNVDGKDAAVNETRVTLKREAEHLSFSLHHNVAQVHGVACDHSPILLVVEFCAGGDLLSHMKKNKEHIKLVEMLLYAYEVARGLAYLHSRCIVHGDLGARNCLIGRDGVIKVADYALHNSFIDSWQMDFVPLCRMRTFSPEVLKSPSHTCTKESDVWAYACLLYEIFTRGGPIFGTESRDHIVTSIGKKKMPGLPKTAPLRLREMVYHVWKKPVAQRIKMAEVEIMMLDGLRAHGPLFEERLAVNRLPGVKRMAGVVRPDSGYRLANSDMWLPSDEDLFID